MTMIGFGAMTMMLRLGTIPTPKVAKIAKIKVGDRIHVAVGQGVLMFALPLFHASNAKHDREREGVQKLRTSSEWTP